MPCARLLPLRPPAGEKLNQVHAVAGEAKTSRHALLGRKPSKHPRTLRILLHGRPADEILEVFAAAMQDAIHLERRELGSRHFRVRFITPKPNPANVGTDRV